MILSIACHVNVTVGIIHLRNHLGGKLKSFQINTIHPFFKRPISSTKQFPYSQVLQKYSFPLFLQVHFLPFPYNPYL